MVNIILGKPIGKPTTVFEIGAYYPVPCAVILFGISHDVVMGSLTTLSGNFPCIIRYQNLIRTYVARDNNRHVHSLISPL